MHNSPFSTANSIFITAETVISYTLKYALNLTMIHVSNHSRPPVEQ